MIPGRVDAINKKRENSKSENKPFIEREISNRKCTDKKITTTLFVPASKDSLLLSKITDANLQCGKDMNWDIRI